MATPRTKAHSRMYQKRIPKARNLRLSSLHERDLGLASRTSFYPPQGMAADGQNNVYIADVEKNRVWMIPRASGHHYGQDMIAGQLYSIVTLSSPRLVATSPFGDLFILAGDAAWKLDSKGQLTSIAGPDGEPFHDIADLATDSWGNLYLVDHRHHCVHMVLTVSGRYFGQVMRAGEIHTLDVPSIPPTGKDRVWKDARTILGQRVGSTSQLSLSNMPAPAGVATQWTMAVNLTTTLEGGFGAVPKAQELKDLAKETEGKPVTIVAQQIHLEESGPVVERFVIKDGKVTTLGKRDSEGFAKDLESLTAWAAQDHPAKNMGVLIQSHGSAIDGMSGDNGEATLGEISEALSRGLKGSDRASLDVLDFDACLMGQQEVVNAMRGVAEHVIASSEVEWADQRTLGGRVDGQPTQEILRSLIAHPEMDAKAFATKTIEQAAQATRPFGGERDGVADSGGSTMNATPTLSHYAMAHADTMAEANDVLGSALAEALRDPASRKAIEDVISRTPRFYPGEDRTAVNRHQRDLKGFSEGIRAAIAEGKLKDPSGEIRKALSDSAKALSALVGSYFGTEELTSSTMEPHKYAEMGGMGVFLPSTEFLHGTPVSDLTALDQIGTNTEYFAQHVLTEEPHELEQSKEFFQRGATGALREILLNLPPERHVDLPPLEDSFEALKQAQTPAEISVAAKRFGEVAATLKSAPMGQILQERKQAERQGRISEAYSLAEPHMTEGWKQFTQALRMNE
ncbi:Clostripain family protein [compost metagenome]